MSSKNLDWLITLALRVLALFMLGEAVYHVSGVRLTGVEQFWPESAVLFARFFLVLWASASLILSFIIWQFSFTFKNHSAMLIPLAILAILHSLVLFYFSFFELEKVLPVANLYVWNPYYSWQLRLEGLALDLLALLLIIKKRSQ